MRKAHGVIAGLLVIVLSACSRAPSAQTELVLGTICSVNLFGSGKAEIYNAAFSRLRELEDIFSANKNGTDLWRINEQAGIVPVVVREELITVLSRALYFAEISDGAFDPSIGSLVKLWGIGTEQARVPEENEIKAALALVDWRNVVIDEEHKTVFLKNKDMQLDLGGIAKGYAADSVVQLLKNAGIDSAIVDLGGNIYALGKKPAAGLFQKKSSWKIGIQDPSSLRGSYLGVASVVDSTLVTSGVYERFLELDGNRYHHILSTETGYPVENGLLSVTILADASRHPYASMDADALSTVVFALGYEKGAELLKTIDFAGAVFVSNDGIKITAPIAPLIDLPWR